MSLFQPIPFPRSHRGLPLPLAASPASSRGDFIRLPPDGASPFRVVLNFSSRRPTAAGWSSRLSFESPNGAMRGKAFTGRELLGAFPPRRPMGEERRRVRLFHLGSGEGEKRTRTRRSQTDVFPEFFLPVPLRLPIPGTREGSLPRRWECKVGLLLSCPGHPGYNRETGSPHEDREPFRGLLSGWWPIPGGFRFPR